MEGFGIIHVSEGQRYHSGNMFFMSSEETCGIAYNAMHMGASKKLGEEESTVPKWVPFRVPGSPRGPFWGFGSPFHVLGPLFSILD